MTRRVWSVVILVCAGACHLPRSLPPVPSPGAVETLEEEFRSDPTRTGTSTLLSAAYLAQGRSDDARTVIATALEQHFGDADLTLGLGLVEEAAGRDDIARGHYLDYLSDPLDRPFTPEALGRVEKLDRRATSAEAASLVGGAALPRQESLGTVVVLPFAVPNGDKVLEPSRLTMAEVVAQDLESSGRTVVDATLVREILRRMDVSPDSWADTEFVRRVGGLVGANLVVAGRITREEGADVRVSAEVLHREPGSAPTVDRFEDVVNVAQMPGVSDKLFDFVVNGPGQEEEPGRSGASGSVGSMTSWVLYGRSLEADDAGDFTSARDGFRSAYRLDRNFRQALERAQQAERLLIAARPPAEEAWRLARLGVQRQLVLSLRNGRTPGDGLARMGLHERAVLSELLGLDALGSGGVAGITVDPGGGGS